MLMNQETENGMQIPPSNFSIVHNSIYRSAFPSESNYQFIQTLSLRSIMCLNPELVKESTLSQFCETNRINLFCIDVGSNMEPFVEMNTDAVDRAVKIASDTSLRPLLIVCTTGKGNTSCIVGCIRKTQQWSLTSIIDEFSQFLGQDSKPNLLDMQFLETYQMKSLESCDRELSSNKIAHQIKGGVQREDIDKSL